MDSLWYLYERMYNMTDPMSQAIRQAQAGKDDVDRVREEALISGAFPNDFEVRLRIRPWRERVNGPLFTAVLR